MTSTALPQDGTAFVTDGGLETDLIFHHGVDLPEFASFPLLDDEGGRALITGYLAGYADTALRVGAGLLLEAPTWRANRGLGSAGSVMTPGHWTGSTASRSTTS